LQKQEYEKMYELEEAHWWFAGKREMVFQILKKISGKGFKILDVGCGTGIVMEKAARYGQLYGLDYSGEALAFCRKRGLSNLSHGSVMSLPYEEDMFDVALCLDVLYHKGVTDDRQAVRELYRVIKPGGHLIITDSAMKCLMSPHDIATQARERYSAAELRSKVRSAGFSVMKLSYYNFFLFPMIFAVRKIRNLIKAKGSDVGELPGLLNSALFRILWLESRLIQRVNFPVGVSLICVAEKPFA